MKWTIFLTATGGLAAFALIFLAQTGPDHPSAAVASSLTDTLGQAQANQFEDFSAAAPASPGNNGALQIAQVAGSDNDAAVALDCDPAVPALFTGDPWKAGVKAFNARDFQLAEMALVAAVDTRPEISYRHYLLGLTYLQRDAPASAVEEFEVALELSPGNVRTLVNLARAQVAVQEFSAARTAIDAALEVDVDDADAWNVLGRIELARGQLEEAQQAFRNSTLRNPKQAFAWNNLGYSYILAEQFDQAVSPLQQAVRLRDDVAYFFNNLGIALERGEYLPQAAAAFGRAAELGHELALDSQERVGTILVARGEAVAPTWEIVADVAESGESETVPSEEEELSALVDW